MQFYDTIEPEKYENRHKINPTETYMHEHWNPFIIKSIEKNCTDEIVIDLACGGGSYIKTISTFTENVIGLDISMNMLKYAQNQNRKLNYILSDAKNIPLKAESAGVIVCIGLFEYIERPIVLREIRRVLKPGGVCIIQCPNKYSAARIPNKIICKIIGGKYQAKEPSYKEMIELFKKYRFKLLEFRMDDGLIWLPNFLDLLIGKRLYRYVEKITKVFGRNPFSNIMLFTVRKEKT